MHPNMTKSTVRIARLLAIARRAGFAHRRSRRERARRHSPQGRRRGANLSCACRHREGLWALPGDSCSRRAGCERLGMVFGERATHSQEHAVHKSIASTSPS